MQHVRIALLIAAVMAAVMAAAVVLAAPAYATPPDAPSGPQPAATPAMPSLYPSPNERIGVGLVWGIADITNYDVAQIEAGWYADWSARRFPPHPNGMDYVQLIPTGPLNYPPNWDLLAEQVRLNPGYLWIIGNESEGYWQERLTPAEYAQRYRTVYTFIKNIDPTAKFAITGVILPSPLRLQWLDMALQAYESMFGAPMPIDVWNTHMQMVQEVSCNYAPDRCYGAEIPTGLTANEGLLMSLADNASYDLFVRLLTDMRTWMKARGFQNKPLMISEYGVLYPSDYLSDTVELGDIMVASFMTRTFEYMLTTVDPNIGYPADGNRLVQRWMWYTLNDQPYNFETGEGFNGGLFDYRNTTYPGTLTQFGQVFKDYVAPLKVPYRNVKPLSLRATLAQTDTVILDVQAANTGNTAASNIAVRVYAGDPAAGGTAVGSDQVIPSLGIRHTLPVTVTFTWSPPPGVATQAFYVVVDPANQIAEPDESDNVASYTVQVRAYDYRILLPVIIKSFTALTP